MSLCNNSSDNKSYWIHRVDVKVSAQVTTVTYMHQSQPSLHSLRIHFDGAPRTLTWQSLDLVQCHLESMEQDQILQRRILISRIYTLDLFDWPVGSLTATLWLANWVTHSNTLTGQLGHTATLWLANWVTHSNTLTCQLGHSQLHFDLPIGSLTATLWLANWVTHSNTLTCQLGHSQ